MNKQHISGIVIAISAICLTVVLLVSSVLFCVYDQAFYRDTYAQLGVAEDIGMSAEDLQRATGVLLDFCKNERDDLMVSVMVKGVDRQAFNQREIAHMVDVKKLAVGAKTVRNVLCTLFVVLFAMGILLHKRKLHGVYKPFLIGLLSGVVLIAAVGLYAVVDFNAFWTQFHLLFFTNDLWLLNPNTSILINMVPEAFFFKLVMRILLFFGGAMVLSSGLCFLGIAYNRRKTRKGIMHADLSD